MWSIARSLALVVSIALSSCATSPPVSCPPPSASAAQALMLRTEPAGATCSIARSGEVVASVEVTPDFASVPRRNEPIDVVCRKGNLEQSMTFTPVRVPDGETQRPSARECEQRERSAGELAAGLAAEAAVQGLVVFFPPAALGILAVGAVAVATAEPRYAFRQPPEFLLAPTTFDSESARDAHFAALIARLEAEAEAQRAQVNQSCHPWPCNASDLVCPNPICEVPRERIGTELKSRLDQIPGLRARARIVPP
jgi:hypothetical protein